MTTVAETAIDECRVVAQALIDLGGTATILEIATRLGWASGHVLRRVRGASVCRDPSTPKFFACDHGAYGQPSKWNITVAGRELVEGKGKEA